MSSEQVRGFSETDKIIARRALTEYMREITGLGFQLEFDLSLDQMAEFLGRDYHIPASPSHHAREIDRFVDRIRAFGGFLADLAIFKDRPITEPTPLGWARPDITRSIGETELTAYGRLHSAVVDYAGTILSHGPNSAEVAEAAAAAAQVVWPEAWRDAGYPVPEDVVPLSRLGTRCYLVAVIHAPQEP